jgi:hypothetical protein
MLTESPSVVLIHTVQDLSPQTEARMGTAVKKTISLPPELAREAEEIARAEGKTLSAVVQDALRAARTARLGSELRHVRGYWSRRAKRKGILTERDLARYLGQ